MLNMSESGDSPAVGEVPVQDGTVPLRSAAMDAYRVPTQRLAFPRVC
jgi:hypothetical protein